MSNFVTYSAELNATMHRCHFPEQFNPSAYIGLASMYFSIRQLMFLLCGHTSVEYATKHFPYLVVLLLWPRRSIMRSHKKAKCSFLFKAATIICVKLSGWNQAISNNIFYIVFYNEQSVWKDIKYGKQDYLSVGV